MNVQSVFIQVKLAAGPLINKKKMKKKLSESTTV